MNSPSYGFELPQTIGPFRILGPLGEGGNGVVFLAERMEQFSQRVAIKILYPHLFPQAAAAAIEREGQILTVLDHPGIVRMLDYSVSPQGLRYIVMEYVDGQPNDQHCDMLRLSLRQRIELLIAILDAVDFAHRHLIIHADLKPANILVTSRNEVKLLDFGVAAILSDKTASSDTTSQGFTALYASPEQQAGERLTIASDIYSLGLIAQLLLAGISPHRQQLVAPSDAASAHVPSIVLALRQLDSQHLRQIAEARSTVPSALIASLRGDLDAILGHALEPDPAQRFKSAQEMAAELRRYQLGYPVQSHPAGPVSRTRKWVGRNKLAAAFAVAFLVVVALSAIGVVHQALEAQRRRQMARTRLHDLVRLTDTLAGELYDSVHGLSGSEKAKTALLTTAHATLHKLAADEVQDPQLDLELAQEYAKLAQLETSSTPINPAMAHQAEDDLAHAIDLLSRIPAGDAESMRARQAMPQMISLRSNIVARMQH